MTSGQHPLVARVIVNRVWRWHFGKGLVRSTDNFGILGDETVSPGIAGLAGSTFRKRWLVNQEPAPLDSDVGNLSAVVRTRCRQ